MEEIPVSEYKIVSHDYKFIPRNVTENVRAESAPQNLSIRTSPSIT